MIYKQQQQQTNNINKNTAIKEKIKTNDASIYNGRSEIEYKNRKKHADKH